MCFYDAEPCDVYCPKHVKARKEHRCDECFETIMPGETYLRVTGIFDGGPFCHKECRYCQRDRERVIRWELDVGCERQYADPGVGGLREALHDLEMTPTRETLVPAVT